MLPSCYLTTGRSRLRNEHKRTDTSSYAVQCKLHRTNSFRLNHHDFLARKHCVFSIGYNVTNDATSLHDTISKAAC